MNKNNFTIKVVKSDEPSPVVPDTGDDTGTLVPDGGLFGQGTTGTIVITTSILLSALIIVTLLIRFIKKAKTQVFLHNFKRHFKNLLSKRSTITTLSILAVIAASATFIYLRNNSNFNQVNAEGRLGELSVTTGDIFIEIELGDEPVYAEVPTTITVNTATTTGYTLYAYVDNQDLQLDGTTEGGKGNGDSSAPTDNEEPTSESSDTTEDEVSAVSTYSTTLKDNTWGIALSNPEDESSTTFRGIPDSADDALVVKVAGAATEAGDTTTLYYAAYITPDLPAGEYATSVSYIALAHPDTSADDITVKYHGNGLTFSDGTEENTVTYGEKCDMAFVGGSCTSAYRTSEAYAHYDQDDLMVDGEPKAKVVTIEGADKVQVAVSFDFKDSSSGGFIVYEGILDTNAIQLGVLDIDYPYIYIGSEKDSGARTTTFAGDTITLFGEFDEDDSISIDVYQVYDESPVGIETEPTTICSVARSNNVDENGDLLNSYAAYSNVIQAITIPGAKKIRIELEYAFTDSTEFQVIEGIYFPDGAAAPANYKAFNTDGENISSDGKIIIDFDSDSVTFFMSTYDIPEDDYNLGFYAKVYPIYDDDQEGTRPIENCLLRQKTGIYKETNPWKGMWVLEDEYGNLAEVFVDEQMVESYVKANEADLAGETIDINAINPYAIAYDGNGATAGTMYGVVTGVSLDENLGEYYAVLISPNFKKDGYGFAGWSLDPNAKVNDPNYIIYGPNQLVTQDDITADKFDTTKTTTLYAVWVPSSGILQNWNGCSALETNQVTALTDNRDNNVYAVAKLVDGNCWMIENLRLDNTATITAENTDHPAEGFVLSPTSDSWCFVDDSPDCTNSSNLNTNNTNIGGINSSGIKLEALPGETYDAISDEYGRLGKNGVKYQWYSYGNYYNWYSATAGTGTYEKNESDEAEGSICPIGWKLPSSGHSSGQFYDLGYAIEYNYPNNDAATVTYPNNFVDSGGFELTVLNRGYMGYLWSRTAYSEERAFSEFIGPTRMGAGYYIKRDGLAVRCVNGS